MTFGTEAVEKALDILAAIVLHADHDPAVLFASSGEGADFGVRASLGLAQSGKSAKLLIATTVLGRLLPTSRRHVRMKPDVEAKA